MAIYKDVEPLEVISYKSVNEDFDNGVKYVLEKLDALPTSDVVEVKHGMWKIKCDDYDCEYMMCSVCREEFYPVDEDTVDTTPNYCMNCGAKMDGERSAKQ